MSAFLRAALVALFAALPGCKAYDPGLLPRTDPVRTPDSGAPQQLVITCGNGQLDDGELCDTALSEGEEGACPTECPQEPCFPRVPVGSGCQTECVGLEIVKAINEDGCCPKGIGPGEDSDCGGCGDGVIGPSETCELDIGCPVAEDCRLMNACLIGVFIGNPQTCSSKCELQRITSCMPGDGCCPPSCNSGNDSDCSPTCGNGIVDEAVGETCEPGSDMPCPASCDDGIGCTQDVPIGSAENCNFACSFLAITAPANGDGCCPDGANALSDDDCLPVCGNSVREGSEQCDPCPTGCEDYNACTTDQLSGSGCNAVCVHQTVTQPQNGDGCCPSGANANNDSDCDSQCGNGIIEPGEQCDGGSTCRYCLRLFHSSLVHRYTFDGSGTTLTDSVGTAHGTAMNCSVANGALDLSTSATNNYGKLPSGLISGLSEVTFEAWLHWDGGSGRQRIFDFGYSTGTVGTSFFMAEPANSGGNLASYVNFTPETSDSANDWSAIDNAALSTSGVHHVAVTFSGTRLSLYLDGVRQTYTDDTAKSLSLIDDRNNLLGRSQFSADPELDAILYEFRIYSKALSTTEIKASYDAGQNP